MTRETGIDMTTKSHYTSLNIDNSSHTFLNLITLQTYVRALLQRMTFSNFSKYLNKADEFDEAKLVLKGALPKAKSFLCYVNFYASHPALFLESPAFENNLSYDGEHYKVAQSRQNIEEI